MKTHILYTQIKVIVSSLPLERDSIQKPLKNKRFTPQNPTSYVSLTNICSHTHTPRQSNTPVIPQRWVLTRYTLTHAHYNRLELCFALPADPQCPSPLHSHSLLLPTWHAGIASLWWPGHSSVICACACNISFIYWCIFRDLLSLPELESVMSSLVTEGIFLGCTCILLTHTNRTGECEIIEDFGTNSGFSFHFA